ncbi:hypothetical protein ACOSP7_027533 [Xanthoceras sorbifolium]
MEHSQVIENPWYANYVGVPEAFPFPAAIEPPQSHTSQASSSFLGSSSLQQRVDCSSSQLYQSQPQSEELAFWESLQKQEPNLKQSGSYHSQLPEQHFKFIEHQLEQIDVEAPQRLQSQLSQQQLRFNEPRLQQTMEAPQGQHSQLSLEQLRFNEPQLQQNEIEASRRQHCPLSLQHLKFNEPQLQQTNVESPLRQHSHLSLQQLRFEEPQLQKTNMEAPQRQQSQLSHQSLRFILPRLQQTNVEETPQKQHSQLSLEQLRFNESQIQQADMKAPQRQHSPLSIQHIRFHEPQLQQTNMEAPQRQQSQLSQQQLRFILPRPQETNMEAPQRQHSQPSLQFLRFNEPQLQQSNVEAPQRQHSLPSEKQLRFKKPQLQESNMEAPQRQHSQLSLQFFRFNEPQLQQSNMEAPRSQQSKLSLQREGQLPQEFQTIIPSPVGSQPQQPFLHAPQTINQDKAAGNRVLDAREVNQNTQLVRSLIRGNYLPGSTSYKGKEKESSSSAFARSLILAIDKALGHGVSGNQNQPNILFPTQPKQEDMYQTPPPRSDTTPDTGMEVIGWNALLDVMQALQACSPPGADIHSPYGEMDQPMFDIPFFSRKADSSSLSRSVFTLDDEPSTHHVQDSTFAKGKDKGKQVQDNRGKGKRGQDKGKRKSQGDNKLKQGERRVKCSQLQIRGN